MEQRMEIWYIAEKGNAPKKATIVKEQVDYISDAQVEEWLRQNVGYVEQWWA